MIDEIHPIEKYPIYVAFPYLKWVSSSCCYGLPFCVPYEEGGGEAQRNTGGDVEDGALLGSRQTYIVNGKEVKKRSKKQKKKQLSEEATESEPLAQLGFGIVAYVGMMYYFIWLFALFTVLLLPVFLFYSNGTAYDNLDQDKLEYAPRTLGALGYAAYQCASIPVAIGQTGSFTI